MKLENIDKGKEFDFGLTSDYYAKYRDIYPKSMYDKLISFGIGKVGQKILDLGSGTAVLPVNLAHTGADSKRSSRRKDLTIFPSRSAQPRKRALRTAALMLSRRCNAFTTSTPKKPRTRYGAF